MTGRKLKPSTLYPLLYKLEAEGYLVGEWAGKGRRELRTYSLTAKGKTLLGKMSDLLSKSLRKVFDDFLNERKEKELNEFGRF